MRSPVYALPFEALPGRLTLLKNGSGDAADIRLRERDDSLQRALFRPPDTRNQGISIR